jgi:hypothetical protein
VKVKVMQLGFRGFSAFEDTLWHNWIGNMMNHET